jgi:Uma2 family endonuclease
MLSQTLPLSLDTFLPLFSQHEGEEWINGEWIARMPGGFLHSLIIKRLFVLLLALEHQGLGEVYQETAFVVTPAAQWVKGSHIPDVMYITKEQLTTYRQNTSD